MIVWMSISLMRQLLVTTWFLSTTSTMGSVRATFLMEDISNPYTSSHQWILSSLYCRSSMAVT